MCLLGGELGNGGPARHLASEIARGNLTPRAHSAAIKIQLQSGINIETHLEVWRPFFFVPQLIKRPGTATVEFKSLLF